MTKKISKQNPRKIAFVEGSCLLTLLWITGCQSVAGVDRSMVNHTAMDLTTRRIPPAQTILSPLGNEGDNDAVGCVTCVH